MTNDQNKNSQNKGNKNGDNFVKKTSGEANKFFGHTVDTSGKIVKKVSGEGGLVGKAVDSSSNILKGASGKANDIVGKTSETPSKFYNNVKGHRKKDDKNDKQDEE